MYNEKQKKEFISYYTKKNTTAQLTRQIFDSFEPYESTWQMDLSAQNAELLQPVINEITGLRSKSADPILIILREYVKWCKNNGLETSRGIFEVRLSFTDKIRRQMVASPLDLKIRLDYAFDVPEKETVDIVYRVFLWTAFAGMEDVDAIRLTANNIDLPKLRINFEGHSYELYKECILDFEKACNLIEFYYEHSEPDYVMWRNRAESDLILRGIRTPEVKLERLRAAVRQKLVSAPQPDDGDNDYRKQSKLAYNRVYLSGLFYRMYERERAGIQPNFSAIVAQDMAKRRAIEEYTLTKTRTLTTIANTMERNYLLDYQKWKCAFDI